MAKTFSTLKTNVGNNIHDTSSAMATIIGVYLNNRYRQVLRRLRTCIGDYINDDYTISVTASAQDYTLPSDFVRVIYCFDDTNNTAIEGVRFEDLASNYPGNLTATGTVSRYAIWTDDSGNQKIKFHYYPTASITVALPYVVQPANLSGDDDETILIGIDDVVEIGATADAWRYKKKFAMARDYDLLFEKNLGELIFEKECILQDGTRFRPKTFNRDDIV